MPGIIDYVLTFSDILDNMVPIQVSTKHRKVSIKQGWKTSADVNEKKLRMCTLSTKTLKNTVKKLKMA